MLLHPPALASGTMCICGPRHRPVARRADSFWSSLVRVFELALGVVPTLILSKKMIVSSPFDLVLFYIYHW
jgi:hypothetical protein